MVRLLLGAGRREIVRLLAMTVGVALASMAIMIGIAAPRVASHVTAVQIARSPFTAMATSGAGVSMSISAAMLDAHPWTRVNVSGRTQGAPLPPGLTEWPGAGQSTVSPALRVLAATNPDIARALGTIASSDIESQGLTGPDELLSYTYSPTATASSSVPGQADQVAVVSGFGNASLVSKGGAGLADALEIALLVLTPAVVFLTTALRLSVAARSKRSFTLGLIGMTPTRSARLYAMEMAFVATAGYLTGALAYALLEGPLGASGLAGIRWWPYQARISWPSLAIIGILVVALVSFLARWSMKHEASRSRAARNRPRGHLLSWVSALLGVPAAGFLILIDIHGITHPSSRWMDDHEAALVTAAVAAAVLAVILGTPRVVAASGRLPGDHLPSVALLGLRSAAARVPSSRRLIGFISCAVMVAAISSTVVGSLQRAATGDPNDAQISLDLGEVSTTPGWADLLPKEALTVDAPVTGTAGTYDVVVGDCVGVQRQAAAVFSQPGSCTDSIQRGSGGIGGGSAGSLTIGTQVIALPQASGPLTRNVTWDIKFPVTDAPWIGQLNSGTITYWVSQRNGSYNRTLAALTQALPQVRINAGLQNPEQYFGYQRQIATIRAGGTLGLVLSAFALVLAALESRWERRRSLCALAAIGMSSRRLRLASAVEFTYPVLIGSVPAAAIGILSGWAVASFFGTDDMLSGMMWAWTLAAAVASVAMAGAVGWAVGGGHFNREALADS